MKYVFLLLGLIVTYNCSGQTKSNGDINLTCYMNPYLGKVSEFDLRFDPKIRSHIWLDDKITEVENIEFTERKISWKIKNSRSSYSISRESGQISSTIYDQNTGRNLAFFGQCDVGPRQVKQKF